MDSFHSTCNWLRLGIQVINLAHDVSLLPSRVENKRTTHIAMAAIQMLQLAFDAGASAAQHHGGSLQIAQKLKRGEFFCHLVETCLGIIVESGGDENKGIPFSRFEKVFITPFIATLRAVIERETLTFEYFLTLPDGERKLPIYDEINERFVPDRWQMLSTAECAERIRSNFEFVKKISIFELAGRVNAFSTVGDTLIQTYQNIVSQVYFFQRREPPSADSLLTLTDLPFIPLALHDDPFFTKFRCSITEDPVRDPVQEPDDNGKGIKGRIYDRKAILTWVSTCNERGQAPTWPHTRRRLDPNRLISMRLLKRQIDERLGEYQKKIEQAIREGEVTLPSDEIMQAISQEIGT